MTSEGQRLSTLRALGVVDADASDVVQAAVQMAALRLSCPIALVTLIEEDRQIFKANVGLDICGTPRDQSFCAHALTLQTPGVMVVEDALQDPRFIDNPLVTGSPHIRFYAGALLTTTTGANLGALCVIDTVARERPDAEALAHLSALAVMVARELERVSVNRDHHQQQHLLDMAETMSGVGRWRVDLKTQKVTWSREVYAIHGVDPTVYDPNYGEAVDFYHPDDRQILLDTIGATVAGHGPFETELRLHRADGALRRVMSKGACEYDADGQPLALFGVFQDVTAQREAFAAVQRGRARYKALTDNVADVIARIALDGASDYISPSVEGLLGLKPAQMAGSAAQAFTHVADRPLILAAFAAMAKGQQDATIEHRVDHAKGHVVWVETRLKLIRDAQNNPVEIVAVIRDISQRKTLEDALLLARTEAEAASAVKSEFLANMSHELRTPLNSIIGFTGLAAAQTGMPDLAREYVRRVERASQALLSTVNDILDFSKLEAGQVAIRTQPTDVMILCRDTLDLFAPQAGSKDIELTLDMTSDFPVLMLDGDRVRQILLNLIGNALKFTEAGQVRLQVALSASHRMLEVSVHDTGPGLTDDQCARLFKRFSQIDGSLTRSHGGTGLGLAICKGLVEAMGGTIGADSTPGQGSRFWLSIPAEIVHQSRALATPARSPSSDNLDLSGVRVLVTDDHPANRELARLFLSGAGAHVEEAVDGHAAVAQAAATPYDIILLDMRMPGLDGPKTLLHIRAGGGVNALTPILAYTADAATQDGDMFRRMGFIGAVHKPASPGDLIGAVARIVNDGLVVHETDAA